MSVVQRSSEVASREAVLIQNKTSGRLEKFQMPSKNRNNNKKNKTNGQVLLIFGRSEQGRASTEILSLGKTNSLLFHVCVLTCQRKLIINNFVLQCFGQYICCCLNGYSIEPSINLSTSDMLNTSKIRCLLRAMILRILQRPKVLMFLSAITVCFFLNR